MNIQPLIDYLDDLHHLHLRMLELSKDKKQQIIDNDINQLMKTMQQETKLTVLISENEEKRQEWVYLFLNSKGIKSKMKLSVSELSRLVFDPEERIQLQEAQQRLTTVMLELKEFNAINQKLIENSIAFIQYSLNLLIDVPEQDMTYQNPMNSQTTQHYRMFDTRA